ncbi:MAG: hypothetical protein QOE65_850 [Solirubrobacteraceae bacterium]|jgi:hypothetical protein|nr:hypothetical protein [Solirubrobacteraceae bacterium]
MALVVATATALVIWVVLWSIGQKALDAGLVALAIVILTATARIAMRYLPGRDEL